MTEGEGCLVCGQVAEQDGPCSICDIPERIKALGAYIDAHGALAHPKERMEVIFAFNAGWFAARKLN